MLVQVFQRMLRRFRARAATRPWPDSLSSYEFAERCARVLKLFGWKIESIFGGPACEADRDGEKIFIYFIGPGRMGQITTLKDLIEVARSIHHALRKSAYVVTYEQPSQAIEDFARSRSITLCRYNDLAPRLLAKPIETK